MELGEERSKGEFYIMQGKYLGSLDRRKGAFLDLFRTVVKS